MKRILAWVVVLSVFVSPALGSSIFGDLLTLDGNPDTINDNSRAVIFDNQLPGQPGSDMLSPGDEIVGILKFESVSNVDPSPAGLYGIFSFQVTNQRLLGQTSAVIMDHGPIAANSATGHSLQQLLNPDLQPDSGEFSNWDNAVFAFVEIPELGLNDPNDPFSTVNSQYGVDPLNVINDVIRAANGYSLNAIVGFDDQDDFLSTLLNPFAANQLGSPGPFPLISDIMANTDDGITIVNERCGLSVLYDVFDMDFQQLSITNWDQPTSQHDIVMKPDGSVQTSLEFSAPNWHLEDDANFIMNPVVPEPTTMTLLFSLVAVLAFVKPKRQK